jgi:uncharacterized protein (DUF1697 family)
LSREKVKIETFISLLRGINVGGNSKINMADLVILYESLGLNDVITYIQSGNVIFRSRETDIKKLSKLIEEKLDQIFHLSSSTLVITPAILQKIITNNPFLKERDMDTAKLYVTFLYEMPSELNVRPLEETRYETDRFVIADGEVYLYCPNGYGRTKLSNNFFEKKLGVAATTRNWKTVNTLLSMADKSSIADR